jgi:hypothetical protein
VGNGLFVGQHDASVTDHGSILVFNNNSKKEEAGVPSVLELKDVSNQKENVLLWKFDLNFDSLSGRKSTAAGNVTEQSDGNLLVCAGTQSRLLEVTRNKEIVWDVIPYDKILPDSTRWVLFPQYRCHWAPQLYFYHFIPRIASSNWQKKKADLTLELFNTGNASDAYLIEVFSDGDELLFSKKSEVIKPNEMKSLAIKVKRKSVSEKISVRVSSVNKKSLTKTLNRK